MTAKLAPGEFDITCGLLSNPRGKLHVTPSAASAAEDARPSLVNYVGALAEYRVFLVMEAGTLQDAVANLDAAIQAGDLQQAQDLYVQAHQSYKRIEPMAELFADLDQRINARAEYFERREADPAFGGFHRLEHGLFAGGGAGPGEAKALAALKPVAAKLVADVAELKTRLRALVVQPPRLASAAARLLRRTADNLPAGGEDRYSAGEAGNLIATLEGTRKIADLLSPLLVKAAAPVDASVKAGFAELDRSLTPAQAASATPVPLNETQRQALAQRFTSLADAMAKVNPALGLE
jgi:iron uptake system component EfeO